MYPFGVVPREIGHNKCPVKNKNNKIIQSSTAFK